MCPGLFWVLRKCERNIKTRFKLQQISCVIGGRDARHNSYYIISKTSYDPSLTYPMTSLHTPTVFGGIHHVPDSHNSLWYTLKSGQTVATRYFVTVPHRAPSSVPVFRQRLPVRNPLLSTPPVFFLSSTKSLSFPYSLLGRSNSSLVWILLALFLTVFFLFNIVA